MVGEHVNQRSILSHGNSLRSVKVILGHDSIGHFVMSADEKSRLTADYTFDSASIAVVDEVRAGEGGRLGGGRRKGRHRCVGRGCGRCRRGGGRTDLILDHQFCEETTQLIVISTIAFLLWQFKREWIRERIALIR